MDEGEADGVTIACGVVDNDAEIEADGAAAPPQSTRMTPRIATATAKRIRPSIVAAYSPVCPSVLETRLRSQCFTGASRCRPHVPRIPPQHAREAPRLFRPRRLTFIGGQPATPLARLRQTGRLSTGSRV